VSDITYIQIENGFLYLSLITDAYSRRIMGYCLADNLDAANSILALEMALQQLDKGEGKALIDHSDRGIQYCCTAYVKKLKRHGVAVSMTETGDPLDNAIAERMNRTIKEELLDHLSTQSLEDGWEKIERAVWIYNYERPHMSLCMLTPHIAHTEKAPIKKYWKKEIVN
jgi:transposase InsO family protein